MIPLTWGVGLTLFRSVDNRESSIDYSKLFGQYKPKCVNPAHQGSSKLIRIAILEKTHLRTRLNPVRYEMLSPPLVH